MITLPTTRRVMTAESRALSRRTRTENSKAPKATIRSNTRDLDWSSGFLEGEGSFSFAGTEQCMATQRSKEPLLRLQRLFGGTVKPVYKVMRGRSRKRRYYIWYTCGARARGIVTTLYCLMSTRRKKQIQDILEAE